MNIVIAPDSFKGSLSSSEAADAIESGIKSILPSAKTILVPFADGGEGTVEAMITPTNGRKVTVSVSDPLMRPIESFYGILGNSDTAVIEMAAASGLSLLSSEELNPLATSTYGTGELIKHALDAGYRNIILGLGGSSTNDGGAGALSALGVSFIDENGTSFIPTGGTLNKIKRISTSLLDRRLSETMFRIACDVDTVMYGNEGASMVFSPQKGASSSDATVLDANIKHYCRIIDSCIGKDISLIPGSGAAGGFAGGFSAFTPSIIERGFKIIAEATSLENKIALSDFVITGEGSTDYQTLSGKVPFGVASIAAKYKKPVIVISGRIGNGAEKLYDYGVCGMFSICPGPIGLELAMSEAYKLLKKSTSNIIQLLHSFVNIS